MIVSAVHATSRSIAKLILGQGFRPGRGLADYLGEGAYFYLANGQAGFRSAGESAEKVARRHHNDIELLDVAVDVTNALNLQHPDIRPLFETFGEAFDRRITALGLRVETNDNRSYYRPASHLKIEAFRRCVEAIEGRAFDVLVARFAIKSRDIDQELPHELCVKRARAIGKIKRCNPQAQPLAATDPSGWLCPKSTIAAASRSIALISQLDERDVVDLVVSIYQGSDSYWSSEQPRFSSAAPVSLLFDSEKQDQGPMADRTLRAAAVGRREVRVCDLAQLRTLNTAPAQQRIQKMIAATGGLIAILTPSDFELMTILITLCERRPEVPILILLAGLGANDVSAFPLPMQMRSRHNLCCIALSGYRLEQHLLGYLNDRWTDGLSAIQIRQRMAARHGSADARRTDARRIVEAYHARNHGLL